MSVIKALPVYLHILL